MTKKENISVYQVQGLKVKVLTSFMRVTRLNDHTAT